MNNDEYGLNCVLKDIEYHLKKASGMLHDTGDFASEELDEAVVAVDKAKRLVESLIGE